MAEILPRAFLKSGEGAIASFEYSELASGLGYNIYYGANDSDGNYILTDQAIYSEDIGEVVGDVQANWTKDIDHDFDTSTFNMPRTIKGDAILQVPIGGKAANPGEIELYASGAIILYDGSSESVLGQASGAYIHITDSATAEDKVGNIKIPLTQTNVKKGDLIRLRLQVYARDNTNPSVESYIGHDPQNRTFEDPQTDMTISQLALHLPFRIDL